jgi:hypothetical protein
MRRFCVKICSGKAMGITYSVCVCVRVRAALVIQHAMHMLPIAIRGLPDSTIFFQIISQMAQFSREVIDHKMCVLIFPTTFVRNTCISDYKNNWARYD